MRPEVEQDVLSTVLRAVRLDGAFYYNAEFSAPWTAEAPPAREIAPLLAPGAEHLITYHVLLAGGGYARLADGPRTPLKPGDVVLFPHGDPHCLGAGRERNRVPEEYAYPHWKDKSLQMVRFGGGGEVSRLVCGYLVCEPQLSAVVLSGLPRMITVNIREGGSGDWLEESIRFSVNQTTAAEPAGQAVLTKLAEALFVETIRRYICSLPASESGWIAGVRDPDVGRALALLHADPRRAWTIRDLATMVGVSRSILAERFTRYLGEPPISYLTNWRLQIGAQLLASGSRGVAEIAAEVGYESEASFNRAFKRKFGEPPARYRVKRKALLAGADGLCRPAGLTASDA